VRLPAEPQKARFEYAAASEHSLPLESTLGFGTLTQLLELDAEHVVELEGGGQKVRNVASSGPSRVQIDFLKQADIGFLTPDEIHDRRELSTHV
jgi:hypothetical protein